MKQSLSLLYVIFRVGVVAGTLDILLAVFQYTWVTGANAVFVLRFMASGLFGQAAFSGGLLMVVWGLVLHYITALLWAAFFGLAYPALRRWFTNPVVVGSVYGALVWVVMNLVVLPFSHAPKLTLTPSKESSAWAFQWWTSGYRSRC